MFTPGEMTHGHYQIELACNACHTPMMGVKQDACLNCHQEELKAANDTHPASKFTDPTNAARLEVLDARKCITCHEEHVAERTHPMGLSLPKDYCYHCHQETLEQRPSHQGFAFDSCATSGCHNYHDNRALYEKFLFKHHGEPDFHDDALVKLTVNRTVSERDPADQLALADHDAPPSVHAGAKLLDDWAATTHAAAGVNCKACHAASDRELIDSGVIAGDWNDKVPHQVCATCHKGETAGFLRGLHGMRPAAGLSPMRPELARLPMKSHRLHAELDCSSCHSGHRFDTQFAAVDACVSCHNDTHTLAYLESSHYRLWQDETAGDGPPGSGVSCATCHMPRFEDDSGEVVVQHNQNDNLRPNEKMIRSVCMDCHGLSFSIDSLADKKLINENFSDSPTSHIESVDMAKAWFDAKAKKRKK